MSILSAEDFKPCDSLEDSIFFGGVSKAIYDTAVFYLRLLPVQNLRDFQANMERKISCIEQLLCHVDICNSYFFKFARDDFYVPTALLRFKMHGFVKQGKF